MATPQRPRYTTPSSHSPATSGQGNATSDRRNVEDLADYGRDGYRPTKIGDVLFGPTRKDGTRNQYTIIHKLGFGPSSTVWCVRRESDNSAHALKIHRVSLSAEYFQKRMKKFMPQAASGAIMLPSLVHVKEEFCVTRQDGRQHWCLVLPLLGPSVFDPQVDRALRPEARQSICEDLAYAVHHLHSSRNACHSNLSPSHVLVRIPDISIPTSGNICDLLGPVEKFRVPARVANDDDQPNYLVNTASFAGLSFSHVWSISIVGFTNAFDLAKEVQRPTTLLCPSSITPPEVIVDKLSLVMEEDRLLGKPVDVWQLGCLVFKLYTGVFPFGFPDSLRKLAENMDRFPHPSIAMPLEIR
ncbi:kinase-like domain-containing protein [Staphylotrichum tortipilum]|uniref:Kinase-like domain-containing protein n=1 Tax=Staphylotrichum tortipilum TaxID=2831512 RepID=A0AAN6RQN2_9PEZI|nr:kinase-like domain-containing protein [Staphylotrichum longicolle]